MYLRCRLAASLGKASWISGGISWCLASVVWSSIITLLTFSKSVVVVTVLQKKEKNKVKHEILIWTYLRTMGLRYLPKLGGDRS